MTDALFALGVVGSVDDQPRQHQPRPVRNLEDELSPVRDARRRCTDCGLLSPSTRADLCTPCLRERQLRAKNSRLKKRHTDHVADAIVLARIDERGFTAVTRANRHIIDRLIAAGLIRMLALDEQQRAGLQRFDAVAVLRGDK